MSSKSNDKLAFRLTEILIKLNRGEKLSPEALSEEFNVTLRTVQRDLNKRFEFLRLEKTNGRYALSADLLGKISVRDIENFACLAGLQGLFASLSDDFLRDIFDSRIQNAFLVKGQHYEDVGSSLLTFQQLKQAILNHQLVSFQYHKTEGSKSYTDAKPYKLVNHGGAWYLAAQDGDRLKAYSFNKIDRLLVSDNTFVPDPQVVQTLVNEDDIWLNPDKIEVVLKVAREAASYFKRRKLIANQVIEKELEDGGLIVSCKVAHQNQILPLVRYWLPSIRIISPESYQAVLEADLKTYLAAP